MPAAIALALWLRRRSARSFWAYVIGPGTLSWAALYFGGLHPALALVPIVPLMPHSPRDLGVFDEREEHRTDTLSQFEHWWGMPVQVVLLLFGFANVGVPLTQVGPGTYYVLVALLLGKPLGILLFTRVALLTGAHLPRDLRIADLITLGLAASIGFTVSLFFATAAFSEGRALAETKMGALLSFIAAPLALVASRSARSCGSEGRVMTSRLQVLIVCAGPIGLTLACHLKRLGLAVRVIEKRSGPSIHSKAIGLQYRVSEVLARLGVVDRFVEQGGSPTTVNIYAGDHRLVQLRFEAPVGVSGRDAFSPRAILIPQSQTEEILKWSLPGAWGRRRMAD